MEYQKELQFTEKILHNFRLNMRYITEESTKNSSATRNMGLQNILNYNFDNDTLFDLVKKQCHPNTFYRIKTPLLSNFFLFRLPDTEEPTYAYIGPYTLTPIAQQDIYNLAEQYHVAPGHLSQLEQYFMDLPLLSDENTLLNLLYTLGEYLWGDADNFTVREDFEMPAYIPETILPIPDVESPEEALLTIQILEQRYEIEQKLIQAVTNGQLHKAELYLSQMSSQQYERRSDNPLRDYKNYAIIMNTLLRKAVEAAAVHPTHIHAISSQYARKIELITSQAAFLSLVKEMVRKYCLLVKNHSLKGYSMLVRKVITNIIYDLTADLSLKVQAKELNVNPSYLSTLFKKETGQTLTEFVNRKRIEHAILLLNSTDMQIQVVAQYCGIPDVNYFTKTFKKIVGKTPKEYREMISKH